MRPPTPLSQLTLLGRTSRSRHSRSGHTQADRPHAQLARSADHFLLRCGYYDWLCGAGRVLTQHRLLRIRAGWRADGRRGNLYSARRRLRRDGAGAALRRRHRGLDDIRRHVDAGNRRCRGVEPRGRTARGFERDRTCWLGDALRDVADAVASGAHYQRFGDDLWRRQRIPWSLRAAVRGRVAGLAGRADRRGRHLAPGSCLTTGGRGRGQDGGLTAMGGGITLNHFLVLALIIFLLGWYCVLTRRNA